MKGVKNWRREAYRGFKSQADELARLLASMGSPLWRDTRAVFLLSTGRTGTDTLRHLLSLSPQVIAFHEPHPQLLLERKQARVEIYQKPEKYRRIFARARGKNLLGASVRDLIYVETSARLTFFAPVIAEILPRSRFIYVHRHPGAVVRSGMRRGWYKSHPADFARITPAPHELNEETWQSWDAFTKICWYWNAYNRFSLDFVKSVDGNRVLKLDAQEIFDGTATGQVYDFVGAPAPRLHAIRRELAQRHNAQKLAYFPKYVDWTDEMRETLFQVAGETMHELGYAKEIVASQHG